MCYLIGSGNNQFKIGRTNNLQRRLSTFQTGSSQRLQVFSQIVSNRPDVLESMLHNKFKRYRCRGEWFNLPDIVNWKCGGQAHFCSDTKFEIISPWVADLMDIDISGMRYSYILKNLVRGYNGD
jgi:hypothetical protein